MPRDRRVLNCAIYTRKSSEEGLEQEFNSLHAQREACEAFITSQKHEGWKIVRTHYDDGGYSGGTMQRPGLQALLADIKQGSIQAVVVYKVDRLTRALTDFAKIIDTFDAQDVSFVSVTQQFNTTTSMGRLTLNVLLSFAQFEREVTGERIRDKIAASKRKGMWMGGNVPLGYDCIDRKLVVNETEAETVRHIYRRYLDLGCVRTLTAELADQGYRSKFRQSAKGRMRGGGLIVRGALYTSLKNRIYLGEVVHKGTPYPGEHDAIVDEGLWRQVNDKLKQNRNDRKNGTHAKDPSLLAGIIFDDSGRRLSPSHASKGNRRYRYYVSQDLVTGTRSGNDNGQGMRLPALEVERVVQSAIAGFLTSPERLLSALIIKADDVATRQQLIENAKPLAACLIDGDAAASGQIIQTFVSRVDIGEATLTITGSADVLRRLLLGRNEEQESLNAIEICAAFRLRRRGVEAKLILDDVNNFKSAALDQTLIKAVSRAHHWNQQLISGQQKSIRAIADDEGLTHGYVRKILPLAFLAPDIVETILAGRQARDLSLKAIIANGVPRDWDIQRRTLGF